MRSRFAAADGFTIIEMMVALVILLVGILGTFDVFVSSGHATHVSEGQEVEIHQAQRELERLQSLPYSQMGLTSAPSVSANQSSPDFYVTTSATAGCPSFQWNQSPGATNATDQLVVNNCVYNGNTFTAGTVAPTSTVSDSQSTYTIYDFVTWVNDSLCAPGVGCPVNNDYKRLTVEVTNASSATLAPTSPVLVSAIVTDPHQLPVVGNPNVNNPLNSTNVTCANGSGQQITCNNGLGNQTANLFYLTNSLEKNGYTAPTGDNSCMHYTTQQIPLLGGLLNCGAATGLGTCSAVLGLTGCPQPDLLSAPPPSSSIPQEYNFSPNLSAGTGGRVVKRDPNAATCSSAPSADARTSEFWATQP
ncbi:MAG: type IV pilus modification PilV family protein, partial [Solirubrobacteraceae bacterium]